MLFIQTYIIPGVRSVRYVTSNCFTPHVKCGGTIIIIIAKLLPIPGHPLYPLCSLCPAPATVIDHSPLSQLLLAFVICSRQSWQWSVQCMGVYGERVTQLTQRGTGGSQLSNFPNENQSHLHGFVLARYLLLDSRI